MSGPLRLALGFKLGLATDLGLSFLISKMGLMASAHLLGCCENQ